jgi:transposase
MSKVSSQIPNDYDTLKKQYVNQAEDLISTQTKVEKLEQQIAWFQRQFFGTKSEKRHPDSNQLSFTDAESDGVDKSKEEFKQISEPVVKRSKPGKKSLPKNLPRRKIIHIPEEVKGHEDNYIKFGEDINEELNYIPAKIEIIEHVYPKYKLKEGVNNPIVQAPAISRPILKGRPGSGLLAHILVSKYSDHLPLDRQVKIFKRQNIDIPKSTMVLWITRCHEALTSITLKMKEQILSDGYVLSDDTPIQVLDKNKPGKSHKGFMWTYGDLNQVLYDYTTNRSQEGPHNFLKGYSGYLQTDGYQAYNDILSDEGIIRMGCWAHARRKFYDLKDFEFELTKVPLDYIGDLFRIERNFFDGNISLEERINSAETVQKSLKTWLDTTYKTLLPASSIAKALKYSLNQWDKLTVYQYDKRLKIDNNFSERCIKSVVIGRKNWMFAGSHEGARRSATIYSIVESCKLLQINPWEYLNDVLSRLDEKVSIEKLTPMGWKRQQG